MNYLDLFSGISAATVAWHPLGWAPVGFAEVAKFPSSVLAYRWPGVRNYGDVREIDGVTVAGMRAPDIVVGGSPCQDLSRGGGRAGFDGARSGLFLEQARIFHAARLIHGTRFMLWENVPGALTTNGGRDFAFVVNTLAGCDIRPPRDGFRREGVALGKHGLVEWAVLDAQWFGLAQRRERLFAFVDCGAWADRPPVLLESDCLRGDTPPRLDVRATDSAGVVGRPRTTTWWDGGQVAQTLDAVLHKGQTMPEKNRFPCVLDFDPDTGQTRARRITPRECERLQGFPDDYTLVPHKGRAARDGPRYMALGNSIAVPVLRWFAVQLQRAMREGGHG